MNTLQFEIADNPTGGQNLFWFTRERMIEQAKAVKWISESDKAKFRNRMEIVRQQWEETKDWPDTKRSRSFEIFTGGWHCEPLKQYAKELGYSFSHCGNVFDLWVSLKETT